MMRWENSGNSFVQSMACVAVLAIGNTPVVEAQPTDYWLLRPADPIPGEMFGRSLAVSGRTLVIGAGGQSEGQSPMPGRALVFERIGEDWYHAATLSYRESFDGDAFGTMVAISDRVIAIGAPYAHDRESVDTGRVYVFERPEDGWETTDTPDFILSPQDGRSGDMFGAGLAVNEEWLMVGSPHADSAKVDAGEVRIFARTFDSWLEAAVVTSPNPISGEEFGMRVTLETDLMIVGAPNLRLHTLPGSAHVFTLDHQTQDWHHTETLDGGPDKEAGDHFGRSISIWKGEQVWDRWIVVGSSGDGPGPEHSGSIHVFTSRRQHGRDLTWVRGPVITPCGGSSNDHCGFANAIDDEIMVVGSTHFWNSGHRKAGRGHVFLREPLRARIISATSIESNEPDEGDRLGASAAIYHDWSGRTLGILLGMPGADDEELEDVGAVMVVKR